MTAKAPPTDPMPPGRVPLAQARTLALDLVEMLRSACVRIEIAGSIRRQRSDVKDIEILCIPKMVPVGGRLFDDVGETTAQRSAIDARVMHLTTDLGGADHLLEFNRKKPANGSRYKRLFYGGVPVDLFCCLPPADWGIQFALRTGPAEWSKRLVTRRGQGGLCPDNCQIQDGRLLWDGNPQPCPEESHFFAKLGVPYVSPELRTDRALAQLLGRKR